MIWVKSTDIEPWMRRTHCKVICRLGTVQRAHPIISAFFKVHLCRRAEVRAENPVYLLQTCTTTYSYKIYNSIEFNY